MKIIPVPDDMIARAISFGWFKRIYTGTKFNMLPRMQQLAVLSHERGHCEGHHTEQRLLCLLFAPWMFFKLCKRQEFQADRYACNHGFGRYLYSFLSSDFDGGMFQPSHIERRTAILQYENDSRVVSVKDYFARLGVTDQGVEK